MNGGSPIRLGLVLAVFAVAFLPRESIAQIPEEFTNLQVLPEDIARDSLIQMMRGFSLSLGVRCQYCHTGGNGISFEGVDFADDGDEDKRKARFMLRMVQNLNTTVLPLMPDRDEPSLEMSCKNCHRGLPKPALLTQDLRLVLDEQGADSAQARYRFLRERFATNGAYDFGEWEVNLLAERLQREGRPRDAIAIYEVNAEFHSESISIHLSLGGLYESVDEQEAAIRSYERVLELAPGNPVATARLAELRGGSADSG